MCCAHIISFIHAWKFLQGFFWRVLLTNSNFIMGRGVSSGGGQSSLGYLFGSGEAPKATTSNVEAAQNPGKVASNEPPQKPTATAPPPAGDVSKQIPAGIPGNNANNYHRADGQNTGNFLTVGSQSQLWFVVGHTSLFQMLLLMHTVLHHSFDWRG
ncbi:hypothetical protein CsSME_00006666 [Camellia sinensis var. sinensis]